MQAPKAIETGSAERFRQARMKSFVNSHESQNNVGRSREDARHDCETGTPDDARARRVVVGNGVDIKQSYAGRIPAIKIGKAWRFRRSSIDRWLVGNENGSGS